MQNSKEYLEKSVRNYQNLLEHIEDFKATIEKGVLSADEFNNYNTKLVELQQSVEAADKQLNNELEKKADTLIAESLLMQKRISMMKEIMEINEFLLPRLASLMDVTRDELVKLKSSISTISGYHSGTPATKTGKIIRKSC